MANQDAVQPQHEITFHRRRNSRYSDEISVQGRHINVPELKYQMQAAVTRGKLPCDTKILRNLPRYIPPYPNPVTFEVSKVSHVTEESGFDGIMELEGFCPPGSEFLWWQLSIDKEDITSAERRYVEKNALNATHGPNPAEFLERFTTSPAFKQESRYGNYRFTFPLTELMEWYKEQKCEGEEPVLRVFKTVLYKQEIMYAVLVHSPEYNQHFEEYPLLNSDSTLVRYEEGKISWDAQAISIELRLYTHGVYVWDQVSLAFFLPNNTGSDKILKVPIQRLIKALEACEFDELDLSNYKGPMTPEERYDEAKAKVGHLKKVLEDE